MMQLMKQILCVITQNVLQLQGGGAHTPLLYAEAEDDLSALFSQIQHPSLCRKKTPTPTSSQAFSGGHCEPTGGKCSEVLNSTLT